MNKKSCFIDLGHGGNDPGAIGQGLKEKDIVLSIGKKVVSNLERCNITTYISRTTDKTLSLQERANLANKTNADCFVSIHCNSFKDKYAKGLEVFSSVESTSDLATILYNQLVKDGLYTVKRGVKHSKFYVLRYTKMRAALIELAFISNIADAKLLREKQDEFAESIARAICIYLKAEYVEKNQSGDTFYRVIAGSYTNKANADAQLKLLESKSIKGCFIDIYNK